MALNQAWNPAGLAARLAPLLVRQLAEEERMRGEEADLERVASQGLGPQDVLDDKHEVCCKPLQAHPGPAMSHQRPAQALAEKSLPRNVVLLCQQSFQQIKQEYSR